MTATPVISFPCLFFNICMIPSNYIIVRTRSTMKHIVVKYSCIHMKFSSRKKIILWKNPLKCFTMGSLPGKPGRKEFKKIPIRHQHEYLHCLQLCQPQGRTVSKLQLENEGNHSQQYQELTKHSFLPDLLAIGDALWVKKICA